MVVNASEIVVVGALVTVVAVSVVRARTSRRQGGASRVDRRIQTMRDNPLLQPGPAVPGDGVGLRSLRNRTTRAVVADVARDAVDQPNSLYAAEVDRLDPDHRAEGERG